MNGAWRFVAVCLAVCIAGCSSLFPIRDELDKSSREYNQAIRWGEFGQAVLYADQSVRPDYDRLLANRGSVEVVDYRLQSVEVDEQKKTAAVWVEYDYYLTDGLRVRTVEDRQKWRYEEKKGWRLTSPPPVFR